MAELLALAVREAPDAATAQCRTDAALNAWEAAAATDGREAVHKAVIGQAADEGSRLVALYAEKFDRAENIFADRAEALRQTAFAADAASTLARRLSIRRAYDRGELLRAAETAEAGIPFAKNRAEEFEMRRIATRLFTLVGDERAEAQLKVLIADREWRGIGRLLAGDRALAAGRPEAALDDYRAALPLLGHTRDLQAALADAYFAVGRWDEAQAELAGLARRPPSAEAAPTDETFFDEPSHRRLLLKLYEVYRGASHQSGAVPATAAL
jgi:predicted Zn-dependent protease